MRLGRIMVLAGLSLLFSSGWSVSVAAPQHDGCMACHVTIGDIRLARPAQEFSQDIHATRGFGCVACHGGDPQEAGMEAMDPAKGYIGIPQRQDLPQVCGHCHTDARFMQRYNPTLRVDQVSEYYTSVHGRRLKEFDDPKVATCTSCHPAHATRPASDPESSVHPLRLAQTCGRCHADPAYMQPYKIPTDQVQKYQRSIHWQTLSVQGGLSAPTCNDCHGNHGAAPPGVSWVGNVCGQCHAVQADLFDQSVHAKAFVQMGIPGCATCHDNHAILKTNDAMLGLGDNAVCTACHSAPEAGGKGAMEMREQLDTLQHAYDKAHAVLQRAEHAGMEVSQAQFDLQGVQTALIKARAAVHAFTVAAVQQEAEPGLHISAKAYAHGVRALDELRFRRTGLSISVLIILAIIAGLGVKIRQLERRETHPSRPADNNPAS